MPMSRPRSASCCAKWSRRNRVRYGIVYLQVTRGVARRDPRISARRRRAERRRDRATGSIRSATRRSRLRASRSSASGQPLGPRRHQDGRAAAERAGRGRPRSTRAPAKPGSSTRPASSPRVLVECLDRHRDGKLVTRHADHAILARHHPHGSARRRQGAGLSLERAPFSLDEAYAGREAFMTSATQTVMPVVASMAARSATASRGR